MKTLIAFLLFVSLAQAAEKTIELPVGTHPYGPFNLNNAIKSISVTIDRTHWTDPNVRLTLTTTFTGNFTRDTWGCRVVGIGTAATNSPLKYSCKVPPGTSRTASVVAVVSGGTLVIGVDPSFSTRE